MKKRFLAGILTLAVSATLFAGCGKEEPAKKETETEDSSILEAEIEDVHEDEEDEEEPEETEISGDRGIEPAPAGRRSRRP